jgi:hypothetical protein
VSSLDAAIFEDWIFKSQGVFESTSVLKQHPCAMLRSWYGSNDDVVGDFSFGIESGVNSLSYTVITLD